VFDAKTLLGFGFVFKSAKESIFISSTGSAASTGEVVLEVEISSLSSLVEAFSSIFKFLVLNIDNRGCGRL